MMMAAAAATRAFPRASAGFRRVPQGETCRGRKRPGPVAEFRARNLAACLPGSERGPRKLFQADEKFLCNGPFGSLWRRHENDRTRSDFGFVGRTNLTCNWDGHD